MPILEPDPWRKRFFEDSGCPEDVVIPTKDYDAYRLNADFSWAYNKLLIAEKQGLYCGPHGILPTKYPVFSKPIYNLKSMGAKSGIMRSEREYAALYSPGHMWCENLEGDHLSTDVAVKKGEPLWCAHTRGIPFQGGTFDYWEILNTSQPKVESYIFRFIHDFFSGYSGMMNFETIGGRIIEMHLRFADQWTDLYGDNFVKNLINLYNPDEMNVCFDEVNNKGYSVVLFLPFRQYKKPDFKSVERFIDGEKVTSVQFSFDPLLGYEEHSMPPGGFRVAIINGFHKAQCLYVREEIKKLPEFNAA